MTIYGQAQPEVDKPKHPSSSWANWKNWKFWVFDKSIPNPTPEDPNHMGKEVEFELPKEFILVAECRSVQGYLDKKGKVWSNEVDNCSTDVLVVTNKDWDKLYKWPWNDIKISAKAAWLDIQKNLHYVDPEHPDELRTICLNWSSRNDWIDNFCKKENRHLAWNNILTLKELKNWKKGANKWTYPSFGVVRPLTDEERKLQQEWGMKIVLFREASTASSNVEAEEESAASISKYDDDNLPF